MRATDFLSMTGRELAEALHAGHPIDPAALDDTEYRGTSLGLPKWLERLTWTKFRKTFHRDHRTRALRGWNVRLVQDGLDAPDRPMTGRDGRAVTFGHYEVVSPEGHRVPKGGRGLLIHYGRGGNGALSPLNRVRDPLVAVHEGNADLLLGWSYVDVGLMRIGTPSFFTLERAGSLSEVVDPPHAGRVR